VRIVNEDNALAMNSMLYQAVRDGTGRAAQVPGHEVAGKTGTSAGFRDAWFVGYSPNLIAGVWVGNDDSSPMKKVGGGMLPAQIWSGFMRSALKGAPNQTLARSEPVPAASVIASAKPADNEGFVERSLNGIGGFLDRLFGGRAEARPRYDERRGGYDNRRGTYDDRRGAYDNRRRTDDYADDRERRYAYDRGARYARPYSPFDRDYDDRDDRRRDEDAYQRSMDRYRRDYGDYYRR